MGCAGYLIRPLRAASLLKRVGLALDHVAPADLPRFLDRWVTGKPFVLGVVLSPEASKAAGLDHVKPRISPKTV